MTTLVTKHSLTAMLLNHDPKQVVGRALAALRQYGEVEWYACDSYSGNKIAEYFMEHGTILDWHLDIWRAPWHGYPRIVKYATQLNQIATNKRN